MGNCFGRPSDSSNFQGEGRTIGERPAPAPRPARTPAQTPGRPLGGSGTPRSDAQGGPGAGAAAAKAAEDRMKASQGKGKLGKQLDAQRNRTQADTLKQASADNRAARDADAGHSARAYN